jgi:hypothetical protein
MAYYVDGPPEATIFFSKTVQPYVDGPPEATIFFSKTVQPRLIPKGRGEFFRRVIADGRDT